MKIRINYWILFKASHWLISLHISDTLFGTNEYYFMHYAVQHTFHTEPTHAHTPNVMLPHHHI